MGANKMAGAGQQMGQAAGSMGQGLMGMYGGGKQKPQPQQGQADQAQGLGPSPNAGKMGMLMNKRNQMRQGGMGQPQMGGQMGMTPKMGGFAGGLGGILARRQQQQNPMASPEQQPINPYMQQPQEQLQGMSALYGTQQPQEQVPVPQPQMELGEGAEMAPQMAENYSRPMAPRMRSFGRGR